MFYVANLFGCASYIIGERGRGEGGGGGGGGGGGNFQGTLKSVLPIIKWIEAISRVFVLQAW